METGQEIGGPEGEGPGHVGHARAAHPLRCEATASRTAADGSRDSAAGRLTTTASARARSAAEVGFQRSGDKKGWSHEQKQVGPRRVHDRRSLHHHVRSPSNAHLHRRPGRLHVGSPGDRPNHTLGPGFAEPLRVRPALRQDPRILDDAERHVDVADHAGRATRAALEDVLGGRELHGHRRAHGPRPEHAHRQGRLPRAARRSGDGDDHTPILARSPPARNAQAAQRWPGSGRPPRRGSAGPPPTGEGRGARAGAGPRGSW